MSQIWTVGEIVPGSTAPATDITKLTDALASLKSNFIGTSLPVTNLVAGMFAIDTADDLYVRNSANNGWVFIMNITLGLGQTWQTFARLSGTIYYNTTKKAITVSSGVISGAAGYMWFYIECNGIAVIPYASATSVPASGYTTMYTFIVPPGGSYTMTVGGTATPSIVTTAELR